MLEDATELRFDAERKGGAMLAKMKADGERDSGQGGDRKSQSPAATLKLSDLKINKTQSSKWQKLAALTIEKFKIRVDHAKARVRGMTTSAPSYPKAEYTGENEWFTPADWIERARLALDGIDLDPASWLLLQYFAQAWRRQPVCLRFCSDPAEYPRILCRLYIDYRDDGLTREWHGRVWLRQRKRPPHNANRRRPPRRLGRFPARSTYHT
jgi:hypothetical protein